MKIKKRIEGSMLMTEPDKDIVTADGKMKPDDNAAQKHIVSDDSEKTLQSCEFGASEHFSADLPMLYKMLNLPFVCFNT